MRKKTRIINEEVDTSAISDPTLLQLAINIKGQKANAQKNFNTQIQNYDRQLLNILQKQQDLDKAKKKPSTTPTPSNQTTQQTNTQQTNQKQPTSNMNQDNTNENYIKIKSFKDFINEDEDIIVNKTHPTLFLEFTDGDNTCVGKFYKIDDKSEWIGKLVSGISPKFNNMTFSSELSKEDIIEQLSQQYSDVIQIDYDEYNNKVEEVPDIKGDENINENDLINDKVFLQQLIDSLDLNDYYNKLDKKIVDILSKPIPRYEKINLLIDNNFTEDDAIYTIDTIDDIMSKRYEIEQLMQNIKD